jgi:lysophospholipase L1-like esterase
MRKISMKWPVRLETRRALLGAVLALPIAFAIVACGGDSSPPQTWTASWYGAPQAYNEPPLAGNAAKSFQNQTFRQTMYVSQGGTGLRIRVSNLLGTSPLSVTSMRVARSAGESSIDAASDKAVTFGGQASVTIPIGQEIYSDSVDFVVAPLSSLAISTYFSGSAAFETVHSLGLQSNYVATGNVASAAAITPTETLSRFAWVTGIDVYTPSVNKVIVTFGDSITDGYNSTPNKNNRYPNYLSRTLLSSSNKNFSVVNAGISGNRWSFNGIGPNGNDRFSRDVLDRTGATHVVALLGINDFGIPSLLGNAAEQVTAAQIIQSITTAAAASKAKGVKFYAGTLTPFAGTTIPGYYTALGEAKRQEVNAFIRTTALIDGFIDFDLAIRDPANPTAMLGKYDSNDRLHPNDAGYEAMAIAAAAFLLK